MHEFTFLIDGKQVTVNKWEDVPSKFNHVIKFVPQIPEPPHTEEQHNYIETFNDKLKLLMERECLRLRG